MKELSSAWSFAIKGDLDFLSETRMQVRELIEKFLIKALMFELQLDEEKTEDLISENNTNYTDVVI